MSFMDGLKETLNNETQLTENGAVGYKTSGKALLDLNFAVTSLRNKNELSELKSRNQGRITLATQKQH